MIGHLMIVRPKNTVPKSVRDLNESAGKMDLRESVVKMDLKVLWDYQDKMEVKD